MIGDNMFQWLKNLFNNNHYHIMIDSAVTPWGNWYTMAQEKNYKVKYLCINPKQSISLQYHKNREEQWFIIGGKGTVTIDGYVYQASKGSRFLIDKLSKHRATGSDDEALEIIEIQTGICKEDDIIRLYDDYGRVS